MGTPCSGRRAVVVSVLVSALVVLSAAVMTLMPSSLSEAGTPATLSEPAPSYGERGDTMRLPTHSALGGGSSSSDGGDLPDSSERGSGTESASKGGVDSSGSTHSAAAGSSSTGAASGAGGDTNGSAAGSGGDSTGSAAGAGSDSSGSAAGAGSDSTGIAAGAGSSSTANEAGAGSGSKGTAGGAGSDPTGSAGGASSDSTGSAGGAGSDSTGSASKVGTESGRGSGSGAPQPLPWKQGGGLVEQLVDGTYGLVARPAKYPRAKLTIVTAASENHEAFALCLLRTVRKYHPLGNEVPFILYDLGLSFRLRRRYKQREREFREQHGFEIRPFDFTKYPGWYNIKREAGQYAWKPEIITQVLTETRGVVLWLDAGDYVLGSLDRVKHFILQHGLFTAVSGGSLAQWVHTGMVDYFEAVAADGPIRQGRDEFGRFWGAPDTHTDKLRNANGAVLGFDTQSSVVSEIVVPWLVCARNKECIAPPGSSRANHRQDQAAISVLLHWMRPDIAEACLQPTKAAATIQIHSERGCSEARRLDRLAGGDSGEPGKVPADDWMQELLAALADVDRSRVHD